MLKRHLRLSIVLAVTLVLLSAILPVAGLSTASYLTTGIKQSGMKQATIHGYSGILVNYTSSYSSSFTAFLYVNVVNSAGQTVYWNIASCSFNPNQMVPCFVTLSSSVPAGTYTARVFATSTSNVPVSVTSSLSVTL